MPGGLHRHERPPSGLPLQHFLLLQWELQGEKKAKHIKENIWKCFRRSCPGHESCQSLLSQGGQESSHAVMTTSQVITFPGVVMVVLILMMVVMMVVVEESQVLGLSPD